MSAPESGTRLTESTPEIAGAQMEQIQVTAERSNIHQYLLR